MQYSNTLDAKQAKDNFEIDFNTTKVLIDSVSLQHLQVSTVDYTESLTGYQSVIKNPNATAQCGCGSSFDM